MRMRIANPSKTLSELRKNLQSVCFANAEALVPRQGNPVAFPMMKICGCCRADVYGYLFTRKGG